MCGICALVSQEEVAEKLYWGLKKLEYRGYDSCGLVTLDSHHNFSFKKGVGSVAEVEKAQKMSQLPGKIGLAHTRWATHGGVTMENAHPLFSNDKNFALVHNGVIDNYLSLKSELIQAGFHFSSQTDTEIIVNLVEFYYRTHPSVFSAFQKALKRLEGCYSLMLLSKHEPEKLYGAKYLLPMILGIGKNFTYASSDVSSFLKFTNQVIFLEEGEMFTLQKDGFSIFSLQNEEERKCTPLLLDWAEEVAEKGGHAHFMIKEILEQPETIQKALSVDDGMFQKVAKEFEKNTHNFLIGIGTTYYIALAGTYLFREHAARFVGSFSADEFFFCITKEALGHCLFISQSGETYDTKEALRYVQAEKFPTSAIVNNQTSSIARMVDHALFQLSGPEMCVVSTKASVAQFVLLERLAIQLGINNHHLPENSLLEFDRNLKAFALNLSKKLTEYVPQIQFWAQKIATSKSLLCMGKGIYYPIALEAALKIKEVSYIHAEGLPTGFLKHGTLALVDASHPCLFFTPPKKKKALYDSTHSAIEEVRARGGVIFAFIDEQADDLKGKVDFSIQLKNIHPEHYPIFQLILAQILAYYTALELNLSIDQPRNLAKSVTVP